MSVCVSMITYQKFVNTVSYKLPVRI